ncbi:MAG: methionine adenosyltransferase [Clostridia bacterium]|nr:methionine adenosyltransferase [Clostridia bacterium]
MKRLFTSESVTEGHPDKICDQISDAILDSILEQDSNARVACETCTTTGLVLVMGEITTNAYVDIAGIARETIKKIGYDSSELGFDYNTCAILTAINEQSADIALGVNESLECKDECGDRLDNIGAGDQGMMFGYATDETEEYMPLALMLAHKLCQRVTDVRKQRLVDYLRPDGKAQVTVEYDEGKPVRVEAVVLSTQHSESVDIKTLREEMTELVVKEVIPSGMLDKDTKIYINPTGRFVKGGPNADSGLTGRKIIVDTYGGYVPHGGGAFSGKDATKVDRSAAYYARYVAKNVVAAGLASKCEICVAYAIGKANPVSIDIKTFGTATVDENKLVAAIKKVFDFRPQAIIENLNLRQPQYFKTASYGHFGRCCFSWEQTDKVEALKACLS